MIHAATGCGKGSVEPIQDESGLSETEHSSKDWRRSALGLRLKRVLHLQHSSLHSDYNFHANDFYRIRSSISQLVHQ